MVHRLIYYSNLVQRKMSLYFRKNKDIKVDLEVPSLPTFEDKKKDKKEKRKADRHLVSQPKHETPPPKDPEVLELNSNHS